MRKTRTLIAVLLAMASIFTTASAAARVDIRLPYGKPSTVASSYGVASSKNAYAGTGGGGTAKVTLPNGITYEYATSAASVFSGDGRPVTVNITTKSPSGKVIVDGPGKPGGGGGGGTGGGGGGGSTTPVGTGGGGTGGGSGGSTYNTGSYESYYTTYTVSYSYTPPAYADLYIASIAPVTGYRYGAEVITTVTVGNNDIKYASGAVVEFSVNGITQTETVNVASGSRAQAVFKWKVPENATSVTLKAEVNRGRTVEESDYTNNTKTESASITQPVVVTTRELFDDEDKRWAKTPNVAPLSPNNSRLEWQENGVNYHAELTTTVSKKMVPAEKSGYGFELVIAPVVTTDYPKSDYVLQPQQVVLWLPEFGYLNGVELERHDQNSDLWQLPASPYKPLGNRRWYVPVWWPDGPYKAVVSVYGTYCPAGELTTTSLVDFNIQGSMYDDVQTVNTPY